MKMDTSDETAIINPRRQLIAGTIGHSVEFFDFLAYSYLAVYFASSFFPSSESSGLVPLLSAFGVFAVGFLARPLAGLFIGLFADRYGRRRALSLTITLMAGGSLLIALCPTYNQIGVAAPIILTVARILQGLSAGGEYTTAGAFIVESAPAGRRGFYSSFMFVASGLGKLTCLAFITAFVALIGEDAMRDYGWRIPFAVGALAAVAAWYIRRGTQETLKVTDSESGATPTGRNPLAALQRYPRQSIIVFAIATGMGVGQYFWATYLTTYFQIQNGVSATTAMTVGIITLILYTAAQPLAGLISDRYGRKPCMYAFSIGTVIVTPFLLSISSTNFTTLIIIQLIGLLLLSLCTSITSAVMVENFPPHVRVSGLGFPYSLSVALFGGTVPLVATSLANAGYARYFPWYIVVTAVITLLGAISVPETYRSDISGDADRKPSVPA
jgi:MHS family alpha-ketoglutarate permease-like MFS transporter